MIGLIATGAAAVPLVTAAPARAAEKYASNTELYADPALVEGADYARRFRRHGFFDNDDSGQGAFGRTAVIAPHGGGIEVGTSELCLAIAGYHPDGLAVTPAGGATYDYWMLEGIRSSGNDELHVTATHCDDGVALSLCAGALNAVGVHGCTPGQVDLPEDGQLVLVGGLDDVFRGCLLDAYRAADIPAREAADGHPLAGRSPANIINRTLSGRGGQVEITTAMRRAMFGVNTRAGRKSSTTARFWAFVGATRAAIARWESAHPIR